MVVIGIDPGVARTGVAVVERAGPRLVAHRVGVVTTPAGTPQAERLALLHGELSEIFAQHAVDHAAVERLFFNDNVRTAMAVGQASGIALLAAAQAGVEVTDYTPLEVKSSVVGVGNATKKQVQTMVKSLLSLERVPQPADAADACALAICHLHRSGYERALRKAIG